MREIKFRFWNKEVRRMYSWEWFTNINCPGQYFRVYKESYIPLQFTGLHDKNNKPIYEGDVVKTMYDELFEIKFNNAKFVLNNKKHQDILMLPNSNEIIGNVYENPELLAPRTPAKGS